MKLLLHKFKNIIIAVIIFITIDIIGIFYILQFEKNIVIQHRSDTLEIAASYAYSIERQLSMSLSATYALATLIQLYGNIDNFEIIAENLISRHGGIDCLQIAPHGIVKQIYPFRGNEQALGHNLLKDPARKKEAFRTIKSEELTLAGPFKLVQGGVGVIGRLPVFYNDKNGRKKFWGFTIVLIRMKSLLEAVKINSLVKKGYRYQLSRIDPDSGKEVLFARSDTMPLDSTAVSFHFSIPNGEWTLSISRNNNLHSKFQLYLSIFIMVVVSFSFSFMGYSLLLRSEVIKAKSIELELSNEELKNMLAEVKTLRGIIPICSYCKKIRDDEGYWNQVEKYISERSDANFSHGICPDCLKEHYPKQYKSLQKHKPGKKQGSSD